MVEPKNSLVKQYQRLFALDKVELEFKESALQAIAKKAIKRNIGARGLRSIMEETLQKIMFDVPSDYKIEKVVIDSDVVEGKRDAEYLYNEMRSPVVISIDPEKLSSNASKTSDVS